MDWKEQIQMEKRHSVVDTFVNEILLAFRIRKGKEVCHQPDKTPGFCLSWGVYA